MHQLDLNIFYYLHGFAGRTAFLDKAIVFVANDLIYVVVVGVVLAALWAWYRGNKKYAWGYGIALVSGLIARYVVAAAIRHFYMRPRPFVELGVSHIVNDTASSFPSGHTIFMFALATVVYKFNKKIAWLLYALGLLIGIARVAGGVHYPSDILGGIVLGILTGIVINLCLNMKKA